MTDRITYTPHEISDLAEGSQQTGEYVEPVEPVSPLKTTTLPIVPGHGKTSHGPSAETGLLSPVSVKAEGVDSDEAQDASLTKDETQPKSLTDHEVDPMAARAPTILIVEDTTELAEVIQATLERMNMVTIHETHGMKALVKFDEVKPDVVLLDISLPDMMGWKILDHIKERQEAGYMKKMPSIVVITAYGDPANRLVGKLQGVYSYLVKPFTPEEVEQTVSQALNSAIS